jgi:aminopeptidase N
VSRVNCEQTSHSDATFARVLRTHFARGRYGVLAPDSFRRAIEDVSGDADALALYDTWVLTDTPVLQQALDELGGELGTP